MGDSGSLGVASILRLPAVKNGLLQDFRVWWPVVLGYLPTDPRDLHLRSRRPGPRRCCILHGRVPNSSHISCSQYPRGHGSYTRTLVGRVL